METLDLTNSEFWESPSVEVLVNPRDRDAGEEASVLQHWVQHQPVLRAHILFRTSGSTGRGKWVALAKNGILASARAVNDLLVVSTADRWLQTLPLFHVGGLGIAARAYLSDSQLISYEGKWDAATCHRVLCSGKITLTSFVPTQLADMVKQALPAPPSLRVVLIGGGRLDDELYRQAIELKWPIRETYGMTETSSQIATSQADTRDLEMLSCWQVQTDDQGRIQISGQPLLTAYVGINQGGQCFMEDPKKNDWWTSNDLGEVSVDHLVIKGRVDRCIKILGELVNLTDVENTLAEIFHQINKGHVNFAVVALEDKRAGYRLILCLESEVCFSDLLGLHNSCCHPLHRIEKVVSFTVLPLTGIGKISYALLKEKLVSRGC